MGTDQLTRLPDALPAIGDVLSGHAKVRLLETFNRAYHAARFATDWAALRRDMTPDEVFTATHLHFIGEMIISMHSPELLDQIATLRTEENIPSEEAQYLILGFTLDELSLQVAEKWQFPELVIQALHPESANLPRAYGIMLGVQFTRNICYEGWYSDSTHEYQKYIAEWLGMKISEVIARTHMIAAEIAREIPQYDTPAMARKLPLIIEYESINTEQDEIEDEHAAICLMPQLTVLRDAIHKLTELNPAEVTEETIIHNTVDAMHDGVGLNRVVFCHYLEEERMFVPFVIKGTENDPVFNRFKIEVNSANLFTHLIKKPQAVLMNDVNRVKFWKLIQPEFQKLIQTNSFAVMSIFKDNKPYGLFYVDRHSPECKIDDKSYNFFKTLCTQTSKIINQQ